MHFRASMELPGKGLKKQRDERYDFSQEPIRVFYALSNMKKVPRPPLIEF